MPTLNKSSEVEQAPILTDADDKILDKIWDKLSKDKPEE